MEASEETKIVEKSKAEKAICIWSWVQLAILILVISNVFAIVVEGFIQNFDGDFAMGLEMYLFVCFVIAGSFFVISFCLAMCLSLLPQKLKMRIILTPATVAMFCITNLLILDMIY